MGRLIYLTLLAVSISPLLAQQAEKLVSNPCITKTTCHECIQTPTCAWCFQPDFGDQKRCFQPATLPPNSVNSVCREEYVWYPDNILQVIQQKELSKAHAGAGASSSSSSWHQSSSSSSSHWSSSSSSSSSGHQQEIVQISPQRVNLKIRISKGSNPLD